MRKLAILFLYFFISSAHLSATEVSKTATCEQLLQNLSLQHFVIGNLNRVSEYPGQWAMASQQIMLNLMVHVGNPNLDFAYFERLFRLTNAPFYLVANSLPLDAGLRIDYPPELLRLKNNIPPKYYLWVGVNGLQEAKDLKLRLGISDEENLKRLRETGFIFVDTMETALSHPDIVPADQDTIERLRKDKVEAPFDPSSN